MNERIKELAKQAKAESSQWLGSKPATTITYDELEKFAELIAQECVDIANNWEDQLENANCLSESNAVGIVAYRIARQFGVKQ